MAIYPWTFSYPTCSQVTVLNNVFTYSMEQSPSWKANRFSASQQIPPILWNPKVHYRVYKYPPLVSIVSQLNPVHAPLPTSWKSILILTSHLRLGHSSGLFPSGFPTKTMYTPLLSPHTCYIPRQSHSSRFVYRNNFWWGVQIKPHWMEYHKRQKFTVFYSRAITFITSCCFCVCINAVRHFYCSFQPLRARMLQLRQRQIFWHI